MNAPNVTKATKQTDGNDIVHESMHDFTAHLLAAREEERKHLANEIHDKVGQNLLALRLDVSRLHARTLDTHPRINGKTINLLGNLDVALRNVRNIINHLRPPVLDLGLLASVEWKVREFETYSKLPCMLQIEDAENEYAAYDGYAMPVVRILHEALTNVVHHANASSASVTLSNAKSQLTLKVCDDGIGISPEDLRKPNAYGLLGVMEYTRMLDGEFSIVRPQHQKGTELAIALPRELNA